MNRFAAVVLAAIVAAIGAAPSDAQVMMGAHVGNEDDPNPQGEFVAFETQIGRQLAIDSDYSVWPAFPNTQRIKWDMRNGRTPMQSWLVLYDISNPDVCATAAAISGGVYDVQLAKQAAAVKALGGTVLVRFAYEMTGNKETTCFTGFPVLNNPAQAGQIYVAAWRHIVGRFRAAGATNVKWVWGPGWYAFTKNIWNYFYPGPGYVDWISVDYYNLIDTPAAWTADPGILDFDAAIAPLGKPMMIAENAAFDDPAQSPDPQALWLNTAPAWLKAHPEITAYVYWDSAAQNPPPPPYAGTGYYLAGPGLAAFTAMANDPYFMAPPLK